MGRREQDCEKRNRKYLQSISKLLQASIGIVTFKLKKQNKNYVVKFIDMKVGTDGGTVSALHSDMYVVGRN